MVESKRRRKQKKTKPTVRRKRSTHRNAAAPQPVRDTSRGKRFTEEEKEEALTLIASGMERQKVADAIGTTTKSLRLWVLAATRAGTLPKPPAGTAAAATTTEPTQRAPATKPSLYAPKDPGQGLSDIEVAAILEYKRRRPSMGPAQLRAQLKRFKGWRLSVKAINRVLRAHGYEPVHRKGRPQGPEPVRFEAPRRNSLWQIDYAEVRLPGERLHLLVIEDDFSRFVVGHVLADEPSSQVAVETLSKAIARHGKPEALRSDRGGAFTSAAFGTFLETALIDRIIGRAYHPQGGGKVESVIGTFKRELWEVTHFHSRPEAEQAARDFFVDYNERRAHMGIDGLCPADRFFGRGDQVLSALDAVSRKRQGALEQAMGAGLGGAGRSVEETLTAQCGSPMEVLRLVLVDGRMELRFCGARVVLGPVEP